MCQFQTLLTFKCVFQQKSLLLFPGTYYHFGISLFQEKNPTLRVSPKPGNQRRLVNLLSTAVSQMELLSAGCLLPGEQLHFCWLSACSLKLDWTSFGRVLLFNGVWRHFPATNRKQPEGALRPSGAICLSFLFFQLKEEEALINSKIVFPPNIFFLGTCHLDKNSAGDRAPPT